MKYRCKVNNPLGLKGSIFEELNSSTCNATLVKWDPSNYPDIFEPVEELSNLKKWEFVLIGHSSLMDTFKEVKTLPIAIDFLAELLDQNGYDATKIWEELKK